MPSPSTSPLPSADSRRARLVGLALAVVIVAAYATSFRGAMVFDDLYAIVDNPLIRDLRRLDLVLSPTAEAGPVAGRPVVNLTLALNYAVSGPAPGSYHAVNLAIHLAAALVLFGLARRTLLRVPALAADALPLALVVASLWSLHPLQTESVTYLIQRAESLCGLFYLLTLYCFARAAAATQPRSWQVAAVVSCFLGMGTKEVMVSAPLMALVYDRAFLAGSWREAWRQRRGLHGALLATWLVLGALVWMAENRGGSAGLGTEISAWAYLLTQCQAIVHYLKLAMWPDPLVFDYGTPLVTSLGEVWWQASLLLGLFAASAWALVKKPALGFVGAWFFLILAPSSSIVPVATQTMAEHRMYLPLAAVVVAAILALRVLVGQYRAVILGLGIALAAGTLTAARNLAYESELTLWTDTAAHRPQNPRAHSNLGIALVEAGRLEEAAVEFDHALGLDPGLAAAHLNLCEVLVRLGRPADAIRHGEAAVRLEPQSAAAHINLGKALARARRTDEAMAHAAAALEIEPDAGDAISLLAGLHYDRANEAARRENFAAAIAAYREAVAVAPDHIPARANLGNALLVTGRIDEAIAAYREVLRRQPGDARVQENLAQALQMQATSRR